MDYLRHQVSLARLDVHPNYLKILMKFLFARTLRAMEFFLNSINYYIRFIKEFAINASVLYELRKVYSYAIRRLNGPNGPTPEVKIYWDPGGIAISIVRTRWEKDTIALTKMKAKIA